MMAIQEMMGAGNMNERIRLLAEQAYLHANTEYKKWTPTVDFVGVPSLRTIYTEKLADLIVRECADELIRWKD
jgi:hypothetical protein